MSGKTSETRCKYCQKRIEKGATTNSNSSGNWFSDNQPRNIYCLNGQLHHAEPTPPEGEAVPKQVKLKQNLSFLEAAPEEVARMNAAIADKYMRYPVPVVSTAASETPDARKAVEDWFKLPYHDLEFRHQSDLCEGTNIIDVACTFCRIITAMAAYACDKSKPNPVAPESYMPAEAARLAQGAALHKIGCHFPDTPCMCDTITVIDAAPVTVEALKVEEVKADNLFGVYCNGNPESVPKDRAIYWEGWQRVADYVNRLRRYSQQTSTARKSPDSHLGAVRA